MTKKNITLIVVVILIAIVIGMGIRLYFINRELQNNKTIYCITEDSESKLEIYYDFKNGKVYRYSVIDAYSNNANSSNLKYKGVTNKIWYDSNEFIATEIYDLNLLTEEEFKEITGMSKTKLQEMSRSEIIDSYIPMINSNASFKCE
jgi:uncharacterized protein YkuJ